MVNDGEASGSVHLQCTHRAGRRPPPGRACSGIVRAKGRESVRPNTCLATAFLPLPSRTAGTNPLLPNICPVCCLLFNTYSNKKKPIQACNHPAMLHRDMLGTVSDNSLREANVHVCLVKSTSYEPEKHTTWLFATDFSPAANTAFVVLFFQ